jgi:hypothetical protein
MDCGSSLVGLGGLLVAAWSLYLSYKSRTSPYREMLYSRQLEGYKELIDKVVDVFDAAGAFLAEHGWRLDDATRLEFAKGVDAQVNSLYLEQQRHVVFMPKRVIDEISRFLNVLLALSASKEKAAKYPREIVYADDHGKVLQEAFEKVIEAARAGLGTEPLSQETLKVIGRGQGLRQ